LTNGKLLSTVNFPCPKEKKEQKAIAEALSDVDALIQSLDKLIAKKKAIKQGSMQRLLKSPEEGGSRLSGFSGDWVVKRLGEFSAVTKLAGFEYTLHFDYSIGGEVIAIRALNLKKGKLDLSDVHTIPKSTSDLLKRSKLYKGDLVISYVGTLGQIAVIPEDDKYHLAPNVAKVTVDKSIVDPFFLNQFFSSSKGQENILKLAASTTQAALSMRNLREVEFPLPSTQEEQKAIA
jgi:type I restriction enzyme S subunit